MSASGNRERPITTISRLARISPGTAVVVLTMEDNPAFLRQAFSVGASGYVLKEAAVTELLRAIRAAAA